MNSLMRPCCCKQACIQRTPVDGLVLIFTAALGVIMEIATSKDKLTVDKDKPTADRDRPTIG